MHFIYFDETKHSIQFPFFFIGGLLISDRKIAQCEATLSQIQYNFFGTSILSKQTELHGQEMFQGKGEFKRRKLDDRMKVFEQIAEFLIDYQIPLRLVSIDVQAHRTKYKYPQPEYSLGLQLVLERFCDYLDHQDDRGIVFGDYEEDEITRSVRDFSEFKQTGKTPMYKGRPLGRLLDTIYFTHSHLSHFLQAADLVVYLANRFETPFQPASSNHNQRLHECWLKIRKNCDCEVQRWP